MGYVNHFIRNSKANGGLEVIRLHLIKVELKQKVNCVVFGHLWGGRAPNLRKKRV